MTTAAAKTKRREASRARPCPVCDGGDTGCSVGADGLIMCRKREGPQAGFVCLGPSKGDPQFTLYRPEGDPHLNGHRDKPATAPKPSRDWPKLARGYAATLTPERRAELAGALKLPLAALDAIPLLGWRPAHGEGGGCWTFPEVDGAGNVVGITCRFRDGTKKAVSGGRRGLTVPADWSQGRGPVLVVEGASDGLAAAYAGLCVIGRPSNAGGAAMLAELLKGQPADREVVVLGEYDPKDDGSWPGLACRDVAAKLGALLGRPASWALPPDKAKDLRSWFLEQDAGGAGESDATEWWRDAGGRFAKALQTHRAQAAPTDAQGGALPLLYFRDMTPALDALDFVEGLLTDGALSVVYGESGCGKTFFVLDLSLHVAGGRPWRGRRVEKGGVIYLALEGTYGFRNRVAAYKKAHAVSDLPLAAVTSSVNLLHSDADAGRVVAAALAASEALGVPVRLIVVDTLSRALAGGNENLPDDMGAAVKHADKIRQETGAHLVFVHHSGKDSARGARGHSLLRAAADTEIEVFREEGVSVARVTKQRELDTEGEFPFQLERVALGLNRHGKEVTSCVVREAEWAPSEGDRRGRRAATTVMKNGTKVLDAIDLIESKDLAATKTRIKGESGVCGAALDAALGKLEVDGYVEAYEAEAVAGRHGRQKTVAFRRKPKPGK